MRRFLIACIVGSCLGPLAWADDTSGISSGIQPGQPWVDDGATLFPGSDRDLDISDDTPHLTLRDSDTDVAWELHVEDAAADPYRGLTLWQGTQTASGGTFTIGPAKPTLRVNQSGTLFLDLLQTVSAARCLELAATGQVTLAAAACGTGGGDSVTVNGSAVDATANLKDTATVTWALVDGGAGGPDDAQATAVDLSCTDCLGTTEIADSYVLNAGDAMTGDLEMNDSAGNSPATTWTPQTGTVWGAYVEDTGDDLQLQANTASTETIDIVNIGAGVVDLTIDGTLTGVAGTFSGLVTANAHLQVGNGATSAGIVAIREDSDAGTNEATFSVPALAADTDYTLPADDGDADQVLSTNGSGVLDWVAAGAGSDTNAVKEYWFPCPATLPLEAADSIPPLSKDAGTALDMLTCDFNDSTDEGRTVVLKVPSDVQSGSTITFRAYWYSAAATTGDIIIDFRHNGGVAEGTDPDQTLTVEASAADTTQGTAGQMTVTTWTETLANLGWAANELVVGVFERDANHASDTLVGDMKVIGVSVEIPRA